MKLSILGGLAALTALLVIRNARTPAREDVDLMVIHAEPRYDTPSLRPEVVPARLLIVPL